MTESGTQNESLYVGLSADSLWYRACVVQVQDKTTSVLKNYAVSRDEVNWRDFVKTIGDDYLDRNLVTAMAFDDRCVGFYHIEIPAMNQKQMVSVVASQAEIQFPLPIEQMRYHWHILGEKDGKAAISIAAAKSDMLADTVSQARKADVDSVVLRSEAILRAVDFLCDDLRGDFNILYLCEEDVKLLFVQNGVLAKVTTFDCDRSLLADEQSSQVQLLCLDIQNAIAEYPVNENCPLLLFSDEVESFGEMVETLLNDKGVETQRISGDNGLQAEVVSLGTALMTSDTAQQYDLFKEVYQKTSIELKEKSGGKKKILAVAVCLLLAVFIAVSYGADKLRIAAYEKQMNTPEFTQFQEIHRVRTAIAQQRVDIPALIEKINQSVPKGVTVDSLSVRRSQRIAVGASCKDPKAMYAFTEALDKCKGVETVRISSQGFDKKKKQTTFTLTFDYKNFTQKRKASK